MKFIPSDKHDLVACELLRHSSREEVLSEIRVLLTWVQDVNWPVALPIIEVLSEFSADLVPPISEVLQGNDESWKYNLISHLIPRMELSAVKELEPEILRIASSPTKAELLEEVNEIAIEFIRNFRANA